MAGLKILKLLCPWSIETKKSDLVLVYMRQWCACGVFGEVCGERGRVIRSLSAVWIEYKTQR